MCRYLFFGSTGALIKEAIYIKDYGENQAIYTKYSVYLQGHNTLEGDMAT